jgi:hypothetical protein
VVLVYGARRPAQIDMAYGDAVTPAPRVGRPSGDAAQHAMHASKAVPTFDQLFEPLPDIYREKLAALGDLKKSLLHQAFSGQL